MSFAVSLVVYFLIAYFFDGWLKDKDYDAAHLRRMKREKFYADVRSLLSAARQKLRKKDRTLPRS